MECAITNSNFPNDKKYVFKADTTAVSLLVNAGITHAVLSNNHALDYGVKGLEDTYKFLTKQNITPIGFGKGINNACLPTIINNGRNHIAIFSSVLLASKIINDSSTNCNCSVDKICENIKEFKSKNKNYIVFVSLHWGLEYSNKNSNEQREQAEKLIDAGADAIIGHHPHVVQPIEFYKNKTIIYSLGNLVFDQYFPGTDVGIIAGFTVYEKNILQLEIYPVKNELPRGRASGYLCFYYNLC